MTREYGGRCPDIWSKQLVKGEILLGLTVAHWCQGMRNRVEGSPSTLFLYVLSITPDSAQFQPGLASVHLTHSSECLEPGKSVRQAPDSAGDATLHVVIIAAVDSEEPASDMWGGAFTNF